MSVKFNHKWIVKNGANTFLNSEYGKVMHSEVFEHSGCQFYIELTPNGYTPQIPRNYFCVWLAVKQLPNEFGSLQVRLNCSIPEIGFYDTKIHKKFGFDKGCAFSAGFDKIIALNKFESVKNEDITINIEINIEKFNKKEESLNNDDLNKLLEYWNLFKYNADNNNNKIINDIDYEYQIKWEFNDVDKILNAKKDSVIQTNNIYKYRDIEFYLELTPNGYSTTGLPEGTVCFWLATKSLPPKIKNLDIEVVMKIDEINWKDHRRHQKFGFGKGLAYSMSPMSNILKQDKLKNINSFTFVCDIKIHDFIEKTEQEMNESILFEHLLSSILKDKDNPIKIDNNNKDILKNDDININKPIHKPKNIIKPPKNDEIKDEIDNNPKLNENKKELKQFLLDNQLSINVYNKLIENDFDSIDILLDECFDFTNDDWQELGIKLGSRKKLLKALKKKKDNNKIKVDKKFDEFNDNDEGLGTQPEGETPRF